MANTNNNKYNDDDDEDETESSIYDLMHAPPLPLSHNTNAIMNRNSSNLLNHHRSSSVINLRLSGASGDNLHHLTSSSSTMNPTTPSNSQSKSLTQILLRRSSGDSSSVGNTNSSSISNINHLHSPLKSKLQKQNQSQQHLFSSSFNDLRRHSGFSLSSPATKQKSILNVSRSLSLASVNSNSKNSEELTNHILRRRFHSESGISAFPDLTNNDKDCKPPQRSQSSGSIDLETLFGLASPTKQGRSNDRRARLESTDKSKSSKGSSNDGTRTRLESNDRNKGSRENNEGGNRSVESTHSSKTEPTTNNTATNAQPKQSQRQVQFQQQQLLPAPALTTSPQKYQQQPQQQQQSQNHQQQQSSQQQSHQRSSGVTVDRKALIPQIDATAPHTTPTTTTSTNITPTMSNKGNRQAVTNPNTSSNNKTRRPKNDANINNDTANPNGNNNGILNSSFGHLFASMTKLTRASSGGSDRDRIGGGNSKNTFYNSMSTVAGHGTSTLGSMLHTPNMDLIECDEEDLADDTSKQSNAENYSYFSIDKVNTNAASNDDNNDQDNERCRRNSNDTISTDHSNNRRLSHHTDHTETTITNPASVSEGLDDDRSSSHPDADENAVFYDSHTEIDAYDDTEQIDFSENNEVKSHNTVLDRLRQYSLNLSKGSCIIEEEGDEDREVSDSTANEETTEEVDKKGLDSPTTERSRSMNSLEYEMNSTHSNSAIRASKLHHSFATDMNNHSFGSDGYGSHHRLDQDGEDDDPVTLEDDDDDESSEDDSDDYDDSDEESFDSSIEYDDEELQRQRTTSKQLRLSKRGSLPFVGSSSMTPGRRQKLRGSFPSSGRYDGDVGHSSKHHGHEASTCNNSIARECDVDDDDDDDDDDSNQLHTRNAFQSSKKQSSVVRSSRRIHHKKRPTVCGREMPKYLYWLFCCCCSFGLNRIDYRYIATILVTKMPCFWCYTSIPYTEKAILSRLNVLCAILAATQIASCLYLYIVMFAGSLVSRDLPDTSNDEDDDTRSAMQYLFNTGTWNQNGAILIIGFCAAVLMITNLSNIRVIRSVDIGGSIRYLWILSWVLPIETFFVVSLFDYFKVTHVWVQFSWRSSTMAVFRHYFCQPRATANTLCAVPVFYNESEETIWCENIYNATNCTTIRNNAQDKTLTFLWTFYICNAVWGCLLIAFIFLVIKILERIISLPLVQKSRESQIPSWLLLPTISCVAVGSIFTFSSASILKLSTEPHTIGQAVWIGPMYLVAGGMFFVTACLGWFMSSYTILSSRDKKTKSVAILTFISMMGTLFAMMTVLLVTSVLYAIYIGNTNLSSSRRGDISCYLDQGYTCSRCQEFYNKCPEWDDEDVKKVIQTQAKSSATLAVICVGYTIIALRYGFNARKNLSLYQIEYV